MTCDKSKIAESYQLAWDTILSKKPKWRRKEINEIIKEGDINSKFYLDFIREVIEEAEKND